MSTKKIPILSATHNFFCEQVEAFLGKGAVHAGLVYEEFFRKGAVTAAAPAFNNAGRLFNDIMSCIDFSMPTLVSESFDGMAGKFLLRTHDNLETESVLIPMQAGGTLCISSQVGCKRGCAFCETGRMGLIRNLTVDEIIAQCFIARHILGFSFRSIVFMGMGEPFDNSDNVLKALDILQDPKGLEFGKRRITISTSGSVEGIHLLGLKKDLGVNLAVSLSAPNDALRNKLMPINRLSNLASLYQAMKNYNGATGREILVAYVMLKGVNDDLVFASELADYLKGLNVKINLIPYNPQTKDRFESSSAEQIDVFAKTLRELGYRVLIRKTKGQKIMAACGQLGNLQLRRKKMLQVI